jgi:NADPH-dependent curcumin reductase CurA
VGIAGGPQKVAALRDEFGFDVALDHRAPDFADRLAAAVPEGIDVYFENVGGHVTSAVLPLLNKFARIPVCGLVADYNATEAPQGRDRLPGFLRLVLTRSLTVRGFLQDEFVRDHHDDFLRDMGAWVREGRVRYREDVVDGLDNAPEALGGMLRGANFGKLLVRVAPDPTHEEE